MTQNPITDMKKGPKGKLIKDDHLDIWVDVDEVGLGGGILREEFAAEF